MGIASAHLNAIQGEMGGSVMKRAPEDIAVVRSQENALRVSAFSKESLETSFSSKTCLLTHT